MRKARSPSVKSSAAQTSSWVVPSRPTHVYRWPVSRAQRWAYAGSGFVPVLPQMSVFGGKLSEHACKQENVDALSEGIGGES